MNKVSVENDIDEISEPASESNIQNNFLPTSVIELPKRKLNARTKLSSCREIMREMTSITHNRNIDLEVIQNCKITQLIILSFLLNYKVSSNQKLRKIGVTSPYFPTL